MNKHDPVKDHVWLSEADCDLATFRAEVEQTTRLEDYPFAASIAENIPVYDGDAMRAAFADEATARPVMAEFHEAFTNGPGIIVVQGGYEDTSLIDEVTDALFAIITAEEASSGAAGDHFSDQNSRLWNSHEKLAVHNPDLYLRYVENDIIRRISESWLGPGYQITTQVNVVRPGGKAQMVHRDYHMGIQSDATLKAYPSSQHRVSASLTLQGAVAHTDMPVASGPTKLLPYSQLFLPGYLAILKQEFRDYFEEHHVQVPLSKGDLVFFNPAIFHAAGANQTKDVQRIVNLMQVGSSYGRSIELVDRSRLTKLIYPELLSQAEAGMLTPRQIETIVMATADGYPFPANLDLEPPLGLDGLAPPSQQDIMHRALAERWPAERLESEINERDRRKRTH